MRVGVKLVVRGRKNAGREAYVPKIDARERPKVGDRRVS